MGCRRTYWKGMYWHQGRGGLECGGGWIMGPCPQQAAPLRGRRTLPGCRSGDGTHRPSFSKYYRRTCQMEYMIISPSFGAAPHVPHVLVLLHCRFDIQSSTRLKHLPDLKVYLIERYWHLKIKILNYLYPVSYYRLKFVNAMFACHWHLFLF